MTSSQPDRCNFRIRLWWGGTDGEFSCYRHIDHPGNHVAEGVHIGQKIEWAHGDRREWEGEESRGRCDELANSGAYPGDRCVLPEGHAGRHAF